MASDLVDDAEWQKMLAEFNQHFWLKRAPAFIKAWAECQSLEPQRWVAELKISIHGLAGVAALVDQESIGDMAREIERQWDNDGPSSTLIPFIQELSDALMVSQQIHDSAVVTTSPINPR
jgi:hypothetical protein